MEQAIFKAYDIRGLYPDEINETAVRKIVQALTGKFKKGKLIIGHDTRLSSPALYAVVLEELFKNKNFELVKTGLITTPMLYFLVNHFKAKGGIMVTASHNPKEYNGLKIVGAKAIPISGKEILGLIKNKNQNAKISN